MAVSIMSACCRASVLSLFLLGCYLQVFIQGQVFQAPQTHNVFLRSKRANQFIVEEILQGNLERECYEELCNYEEAREYFEEDAKTTAFWTVYVDGDQCKPNPCLNGGNCTDKVGGFQCSCPAPYDEPVCELGAVVEKGNKVRPLSAAQIIQECPTEGPTACHQLCTVSHFTFTCSCMSGFKLQTDGRSCVPEVEFPCGRLPDHFNMTESMCHHGNCPWQVSLLNRRGVELCGGVVLGRFSVLTAARCLFLDSRSDLRPSNFYVVAGDKSMPIPVQALYVHHRFRPDHHDNNLALLELARPLHFNPALIHLCLPTKDFSENILMHSGRAGISGRREVSQNQKLVYMTLDECRNQLNVSHPLSNKMFCMRRQNGASGNQNRVKRRLNGPSGNQNGTQGSPNQPLETQNGAQEKLNEQTVNQNQSQKRKNGTENSASSKSHGGARSEVSAGKCGGLLPGTPVASVEQGTAFLTGLLLSSTANCEGGGLVFIKLSRYLNWIKPRLEATRAHMTTQVLQYPENR